MAQQLKFTVLAVLCCTLLLNWVLISEGAHLRKWQLLRKQPFLFIYILNALTYISLLNLLSGLLAVV